jgi:hypothetical protein
MKGKDTERRSWQNAIGMKASVPHGGYTQRLTGYEINLVCNRKEISRAASDFMKWPTDPYGRVSYGEVYNSDLFYELPQS